MSKLSLAVLSIAAGLAFSAAPASAAPVAPVAPAASETQIVPAQYSKKVTIRRGRRCTVKRVVTRRYGRRTVRVVRRCRW